MVWLCIHIFESDLWKKETVFTKITLQYNKKKKCNLLDFADLKVKKKRISVFKLKKFPNKAVF